MTMDFEILKEECPKAVFDEISKLNHIDINDIGFEHKITNKTADWLAEYTNDANNNGFFVDYVFSRD